MATTRRAVVYSNEEDRVARFLPDNYEVVTDTNDHMWLIIEGRDVGGWTLDDYVIPRLASGLIYCKELYA